MSERLVSIVLPTYNRADYLHEAVDNILQQTYQRWELIIVNDGSTDNTQAIMTELAHRDKRIRAISHEQNKGLPSGLNTGFEHAKGEYITWTSDDNFYRPHAIETMAETLDQCPDIDIVYADFSVIDEAGRVIRYRRVPPPNELVHIAVVGACFLYRRDVHETINGYDTDLFLVEDYDFWVRASMQFQLQPIHQDLYLYQEHEGTLTSRREAEIMAKREAMLARHLPNLPWATHVDLARGYLHLATLAYRTGNSARMLGYVAKAIVNSPATVIRHYTLKLMPPSIQKEAVKWYKKMVR